MQAKMGQASSSNNPVFSSPTTRRSDRIYFSNFFHRLICAATFFGGEFGKGNYGTNRAR